MKFYRFNFQAMACESELQLYAENDSIAHKVAKQHYSYP